MEPDPDSPARVSPPTRIQETTHCVVTKLKYMVPDPDLPVRVSPPTRPAQPGRCPLPRCHGYPPSWPRAQQSSSKKLKQTCQQCHMICCKCGNTTNYFSVTANKLSVP